jgi:hypothetical protein
MDVSLCRKWIVKFVGTFFRTYIIGCVSIVAFATLLFSGCTNGGVGERASFISPSDGHQDSFGMGEAAQSSAIVDWSKAASEQSGYDAPTFGGRSAGP